MYIKKLAVILTLILSALLFSSCGEGNVDVTGAQYESKIVFDGYIYPGQKVENIKITRNFPLNRVIDPSQVVLSGADVSITDITESKTYKLSFDPQKQSFSYHGADLQILSGRSYRLDVKARVDGKDLTASAVTKVPLNGFHITQKDMGTLTYRQKDEAGALKYFNAKFTPSKSSDFYAISIVPVASGFSDFVFDNGFFKPDSADIKENFDNYKYQYRWLQNVNPAAPSAEYKIEWFDTWFYGEYRVIIYAADKNFADFVITNKMIQEPDGNFHEPKFHLEGDGIGVFGSAIADTAYFKIIR